VSYNLLLKEVSKYLPRWLRWLRHSAHRLGRSIGEAGVQFLGLPVDFMFRFQGRMLWD